MSGRSLRSLLSQQRYASQRLGEAIRFVTEADGADVADSAHAA